MAAKQLIMIQIHHVLIPSRCDNVEVMTIGPGVRSYLAHHTARTASTSYCRHPGAENALNPNVLTIDSDFWIHRLHYAIELKPYLPSTSFNIRWIGWA